MYIACNTFKLAFNAFQKHVFLFCYAFHSAYKTFLKEHEMYIFDIQRLLQTINQEGKSQACHKNHNFGFDPDSNYFL